MFFCILIRIYHWRINECSFKPFEMPNLCKIRLTVFNGIEGLDEGHFNFSITVAVIFWPCEEHDKRLKHTSMGVWWSHILKMFALLYYIVYSIPLASAERWRNQTEL